MAGYLDVVNPTETDRTSVRLNFDDGSAIAFDREDATMLFVLPGHGAHIFDLDEEQMAALIAFFGRAELP